jgi:hypothetical protein
LLHYTWTTTGIGFVLAGVIFYLLRRDLLHTRYAVWWLGVALASVVLGIFPVIADRLAALLGVTYPPSLFFLIGLGLVLVKILTMDLDQSHQEQRMRRLAQEMVILEDRVEQLSRLATPDKGEPR